MKPATESANRIYYYDTIRFLAVFWVFVTHFDKKFGMHILTFFNSPKRSALPFMYGITGKMAVSMFAVILGFFAYNAHKRHPHIFEYIATRYLYFLLCGGTINVVYYVVNRFYPLSGRYIGLREVIATTVRLGSGIFSPFWCILPFFMASCISYINGKYRVGLSAIAVEIIMLFLLGQTWVAVCLLGNAYATLIENESFQKWFAAPVWKRIAAFVMVFILVKRPESDNTYLIDGACCVFLLLITYASPKIQRLYNIRVLVKLGQNSLGFYLIHVLCYRTVGKYLLKSNPLTGSDVVNYFVALTASFVVAALLSFPITRAINFIHRTISGVIDSTILYWKSRTADGTE